MEVAKGIEVMELSADVLVVALHHRKVNQQHKNHQKKGGDINENLYYNLCRLRRQNKDRAGL